MRHSPRFGRKTFECGEFDVKIWTGAGGTVFDCDDRGVEREGLRGIEWEGSGGEGGGEGGGEEGEMGALVADCGVEVGCEGV
jgi:hypothetical protein